MLMRTRSALFLGTCSAMLIASTFALAEPAAKPAAPATPAAPAAPSKPAAPGAPDAKGMDMKAMEEAWDKAAKPGPEHKALNVFEGTWNVEGKDMMTQSAGKMTGTTEYAMVMGGRFLSINYDGRYQGKFMTGKGYLGYNNVSKQYEQVWMDSMTTGMSPMTGSMSKDGKSIILTGPMDDPMTGSKIKTRQVITMPVNGSFTIEFFGELGGKDIKMSEMTFTKGAPAETKTDAKPEPKPAPAKKN
jgi:hypothetical protein